MTTLTDLNLIAQSLDPAALATLLEAARALAGEDLPEIAEGSPIPQEAKASGAGWIELKYIPRLGKLYGPYRYMYRWDATRKTKKFVKYLGKASKTTGSSGPAEEAPAPAEE